MLRRRSAWLGPTTTIANRKFRLAGPAAGMHRLRGALTTRGLPMRTDILTLTATLTRMAATRITLGRELESGSVDSTVGGSVVASAAAGSANPRSQAGGSKQKCRVETFSGLDAAF